MFTTRINPITIAVCSSLLLSVSSNASAECERDEFNDSASPIIYCNGETLDGLYPNEVDTEVVVNEGATVSQVEFDAVFFSNYGEMLNFGSVIAGSNPHAVGVGFDNGGRIHNFENATISSANGQGVFLNNGGQILNDGLIDTRFDSIFIETAAEFVYNTGTIRSVEDAGVYAKQYVEVNNDGGSIEGGRVGVQLLDVGDVYNQNGGYISGNTGVQLDGFARVSNTGEIVGADRGVVLVDSTLENLDGGVIRGGTLGVYAERSVVNNDASLIEGGRDGVEIRGFELNNSNNGIIRGLDGAGVVAVDEYASIYNDGEILGKYDGIYTNTYTDINNAANGSIVSTLAAGINAQSGANVSNDGTVEGTWAGVYVQDDGFVFNGNTGTISAADGDGIVFENGGEALNDGSITAGSSPYAAGVVLKNGGRVHNFENGIITSANGTGVNIDNGGELLNDGLIESQQQAILVGNDANFVYNTGTLRSTESHAVFSDGSVEVNNDGGSIVGAQDGVFLRGGGGVFNQNGGSIEGSRNAIRLEGDGEVFNTGTLTSENEDAVVSLANAFVNNDSGVIVGGSNGVNMNGGGTVVNQNGGSIAGRDGAAIVIQNEFTRVYNQGALTAKWDGVYADVKAEIFNDDGASIAVTDGAGININAIDGEVFNSGSIQGVWAGVHTENSGLIVNNATGNISANTDYGRAVSLSGGGFFVNRGSVEAATGVQTIGSSDSGVLNESSIVGLSDDGVRMIGGGEISNSGNINGGVLPESNSSSDGIAAFDFDTNNNNTFIATNTGTVTGYRNGMTISQIDSEVVNEGIIQGNDGGILIQGSSSVDAEKRFSATITNTGRIEALGNGPLVQSEFITPEESAAVGVRAGMDLVTLDNSGVITANATAIRSESRVVVNNTSSGLIQADANNNGVGKAMLFITEDKTNAENIALGRHDDVINNSGVINGDMMLGAGNDTFSQIGETAQNTGNIDGGSGYDTFSVSVAEGESSSINASALSNVEVFEKVGAGFITYDGSAEFEEVFVRQGQLSLAENSIINLQTSLNNPESGLLTVSDGGILSGGGTIFGTVNVEDGGILNPGFSPGTLTIDGDLNLGEGGVLQVQIEELADGSIVYDTYEVLGGFDITGGAVELLFSSALDSVDIVSDLLSGLDFSDMFSFSTDELFDDFTEALTTTASFFTSADDGETASTLSFNSPDASFDNVTLTEGAVLPSQTGAVEVNTPSTIWMFGLFAGALAFFRRFKR